MLRLRGGRPWRGGGARAVEPLAVARGVVVAGGASAEAEADLAGRAVLPGLVNAHDHLDFSTFPPLGRPPYASAYVWVADVGCGRDDLAVAAALAVPLPDRLFLRGLRNLLAGATAVAHHGPYHRALARPDFPVRVLARYQVAHSPGVPPAARRTYRATGRRPRDRGRRGGRSRGEGDERRRGGRARDRGRHGSGPACRSRRDRFHGGVAGRRSARAGAGDGGGAASLRRPAAPRRARSPLATRHRGWRRARIGRGAGP